MRTPTRLAIGLAAAVMVVAACGDSGTEATDESAATPSSSSATTEAAATHGEYCLQHDDVERCYLTVEPADLAGPAPLVIDIHGWGSNPSTHRSYTGFAELAETEGFVVAYPTGTQNSFNAGGLCCPPATTSDVDDVGYILAIIDDVSARMDIDETRIYATGHSNGCAMSQRLAAEASDTIAAVACMALYLLTDASSDYTPVPILEIHGTDDAVVAYSTTGQFGWGALPNLETWAELNQCAGEPITSPGPDDSAEYTTYEDCADGTVVSLLTLDGVGHAPYAPFGTSIDTTRIAWDFLRRYPAT